MKDAKSYTRIHYPKYYDRALKRTRKYAIVLERLISPEGTFPVFGRSIPYRMATMQPLALMAWYDKLPAGLTPGQVRAALTAVMHNMFDGKENFNEKDFLTIGFVGRQPNVADWYTNNGSLYMTSLAFMPLGLPTTHPFGQTPHKTGRARRRGAGSHSQKTTTGETPTDESATFSESFMPKTDQNRVILSNFTLFLLFLPDIWTRLSTFAM